MKTGDIYGGGGNYLTAEDLKGRQINVRIEAISTVTMTDTQKKKIVLHFQGTDKALPLNVTNATTVAELLGSDETDDWIGRRICLHTQKVNFQGKMVPAIRIKEAPIHSGITVKPKAKPLPPPDPDEVEDNTPLDDESEPPF